MKLRGLLGSSCEIITDLRGNVGLQVTTKQGTATLLLTASSADKLGDGLKAKAAPGLAVVEPVETPTEMFAHDL